MAVAKLKISKPNASSGILVIGMFKDHSWYLETPVDWFPGTSGKWTRVRNATKFRQFSFLRLADEKGVSVADFPEPPYTLNSKFKASLVSHAWIFEMSGEDFDVEVQQCPPPEKKLRIREIWAANVSYAVVQGEALGLEIEDEKTHANAIYVYKGAGLSIGLPKIPKVGDAVNKVKDALSQGSGSTSGPWNDFTAPGWMGVEDFEGDAVMQTYYNLGLGTDKSSNSFQFGGHIDNMPGYLVLIKDFSTGRTFGLPSTTMSAGSMTLWKPGPAPTTPAGGHGKFGTAGR